MDTIRVQIDGLDVALSQVLTEYSDEVCKRVDKCAQKSMKELVEATKADAPFNENSSGKHYRDLISSRRENFGIHRAVYTWYVKAPKFRIAHLLNNGHVIRRAGRIAGHYSGDRHVTKNADKVMAECKREVEEAVRSAGH